MTPTGPLRDVWGLGDVSVMGTVDSVVGPTVKGVDRRDVGLSSFWYRLGKTQRVRTG